MKLLYSFSLSVLLLPMLFAGSSMADVITTTGTGNWSSTVPDAPWPGGTLPTAGDAVIVADGHEVTLDQDATIVGLTVGQGTSGIFQTSKTVLTNLTINGNLLVNAGGIFRAQTATSSFVGPHTLSITGNITHSGTIFDLRVGTAGSTLGVINVTFVGSGNSAVTMNGSYSSSNGDFNAVTINKTGPGKIILGSDVYINSGSSTGPQTMTSILTFVNGIVETGNFTLVAQTSTAANVTGASGASYVIGAMGRGMSNSGGSTKDFPVGDANGYRPINLRSTTAGSSTGHHAIVRMISGDANSSSSLGTGIDRVSQVRYYRISYSNAIGGAATMNFDRFYPSYGTDDGVEAGNTDLRVAYSTNNRANWNALGQTTNPHTTDLTSPPTQIRPDSLNPAVTLSNGGNPMFICLANMTGGSNPLPVQLASFAGQYVSQSSVRLTWRTVSEVNNYGFMVERRHTGESIWVEVANGFVAGSGTTSQPQNYTFTDATAGGVTLEYRLRQIDMDGSVNYSEPIMISSPTSVAERVPERFELQQNYPNPFNPGTTINFSVAKNGRAVLDVFTVLGEKVATLYDGIVEGGTMYTARFDGASLASGVYLYRLTSGNSVQIKRMHLMK